MANLRRFYFGTYANGALTGQNGWGTITDGTGDTSYDIAAGKLVLDMNDAAARGNEIQNIFSAGAENTWTTSADYVLYFTYSKAGSGSSLLRICGDPDWADNGETVAMELSSASTTANQLKTRVVTDETATLTAFTCSENVRHMLWGKFVPGTNGVNGTFKVFLDGTQVFTATKSNEGAVGFWGFTLTRFSGSGTGRPVYLVDEMHAANGVPLVMAQSTTGATVGSAIRVDCVGLPPGESFSVVLQQGDVNSPSFQSSELATGTADSNGYLSVSFASPPETPLGTNYVKFTGDGDTTAVSQDFTIAAVVVPPEGGVLAVGSAGGFGFGF